MNFQCEKETRGYRRSHSSSCDDFLGRITAGKVTAGSSGKPCDYRRLPELVVSGRMKVWFLVVSRTARIWKEELWSLFLGFFTIEG